MMGSLSDLGLCLTFQEMVTVSVDSSVLDCIAKIVSYLCLHSFGKFLKKKKKERDVNGSCYIQLRDKHYSSLKSLL